jgi:hypothetical protein
MKSTDINLPSNTSFGVFFSICFALLSAYFFYIELISYFLISISVSFFFGITTIINPKILLPLNKLWMKFGLLLGLIVNPIIMGIIFFFLLTPISLLTKIFRRDELKIRKNLNLPETYWNVRQADSILTKKFDKQY